MNLRDCSEIKDAARLVNLLRVGGRLASPATRQVPVFAQPTPQTGNTAVAKAQEDIIAHEQTVVDMTRQRPAERPAERSEPPPPTGDYLSDRITNVLLSMCRRGGFTGALVADMAGLPLADYNCDSEVVGACSSVLGHALEQSARLLNQKDANTIAMDINYVEKIVLRHFDIHGAGHYLMVLCPQSVDERGEVELAIRQIAAQFRSTSS